MVCFQGGLGVCERGEGREGKGGGERGGGSGEGEEKMDK